MKIHILTLSLTAIALFAACGQPEETADAYGNFEADEVRISAQQAGPIL
ncbi:MAG TPA: HlyD family secretion protein, partial [Phaeodactylibacter sp.]|nr:HlyD family secretion protein [Phaeodactylibacter sp.]